jgi:hypothetical protein
MRGGRVVSWFGQLANPCVFVGQGHFERRSGHDNHLQEGLHSSLCPLSGERNQTVAFRDQPVREVDGLREDSPESL